MIINYFDGVRAMFSPHETNAPLNDITRNVIRQAAVILKMSKFHSLAENVTVCGKPASNGLIETIANAVLTGTDTIMLNILNRVLLVGRGIGYMNELTLAREF